MCLLASPCVAHHLHGYFSRPTETSGRMRFHLPWRGDRSHSNLQPNGYGCQRAKTSLRTAVSSWWFSTVPAILWKAQAAARELCSGMCHNRGTPQRVFRRFGVPFGQAEKGILKKRLTNWLGRFANTARQKVLLKRFLLMLLQSPCINEILVDAGHKSAQRTGPTLCWHPTTTQQTSKSTTSPNKPATVPCLFKSLIIS